MRTAAFDVGVFLEILKPLVLGVACVDERVRVSVWEALLVEGFSAALLQASDFREGVDLGTDLVLTAREAVVVAASADGV